MAAHNTSEAHDCQHVSVSVSPGTNRLEYEAALIKNLGAGIDHISRCIPSNFHFVVLCVSGYSVSLIDLVRPTSLITLLW